MTENIVAKGCTRCYRVLPLSDFRLTTKNGRPYHEARCADCQRQASNARYHRNKVVTKQAPPEELEAACIAEGWHAWRYPTGPAQLMGRV
jgi:hypothetical protein